ncbi:xanthine dehydrogenase family protein subunit M [Pelagivirga sediminicola]|uniref:Xanthine dehydrogenase family protein subunit M n=1 Tax=Pelagivirga sediminicola TaxID=2170575 RepID=A0A2T7G3A5_9RHOB|nr:FAD binding domain-containing protein [Pelagivirga sediminicola]PVA08905.1 xanthine dehydrogenase family protein subunit M [Pelagivirga sediminicola]
MTRMAIDEPRPFTLHEPAEVDAALALAAEHFRDHAYLAGGCDLLDQLKRQWRNRGHVINLKGIDALSGIRRADDRLRIGALTKLSALERDSDLAAMHPALALGAARIATPQIRNMGTIGGNLLQDSRCPYYRGPWYCYRHGGIVCDAHHGINAEHAIFGGDRCYTVTPSDLGPVVVALDAMIEVVGHDGARTLAARDLFMPPGENITVMHRLQNGEILTAIEIPVRKGQRSAFVKNAPRNAWDFSRASVAITLEPLEGRARIVLGGVAAIPWRCHAAERVIEGASLDQKTIDAAAIAATDGAEPLSHNAYKVGLVRKLVREALTQLA